MMRITPVKSLLNLKHMLTVHHLRCLVILLFYLYLQPVFAATQITKFVPSLYVVEKSKYDYHVNSDATSTTIVEKQLLIKDQSMVEGLSTAEITFNSSQKKVEILEAYTILPSGEKVLVEPKAIRLVDAENGSSTTSFSDEKKYSIIFPGVTPGARTYYKARTVTHTPILTGMFTARLTFTPHVEFGPVEINLSHDPAIKVYSFVRDLPGGRIEDGAKGEIRYRYNFAQDKIVARESAQISIYDFAPTVIFSTFENPATLGALLEKLYMPKFSVTPRVQKITDEVTVGITDPKAQARAIYNWVNKNIRYVALFLGDGGLVPNNADSILENRYGDCKDHDVLLIAMLAAKGISATTASINLGSAFETPTLGTIYPFNHVITYIPQWDLFLDSTQEMLPFGILPAELADKPALLTATGKMVRTPNLSADTNKTLTRAKLSIASDGKISGQTKTEYFGVLEYLARTTYSSYVGQSKETMVRNHLNIFNEVGTGSYMPTDVYALDTPLVVSSEFNISSMSNFPGPAAMTIPIGLATGELTIKGYDNPNFEVTRPFICSSYTYEEHYELVFDPSIKLSRVPQGVSHIVKKGTEHMEYKSSYVREGQIIQVSRSLRSQQAGRVCQPESMDEYEKMHRVIRRDILSQIFYE